MSMQTELQGAEASVTQSNPLTPISQRWDWAYMRRKACEDLSLAYALPAAISEPIRLDEPASVDPVTILREIKRKLYIADLTSDKLYVVWCLLSPMCCSGVWCGSSVTCIGIGIDV